MWLVADGATFAQGRMSKDKGPGLVAMTLGATFIRAGHGQATGRFEGVSAVRVMALDAIHVAFHDRVMLG